jgi:hypothetical protein
MTHGNKSSNGNICGSGAGEPGSHAKLKATGCHKKEKNPRSLRAWESTESLPLNLGFWLAAGGVEGWACRLVGLI